MGTENYAPKTGSRKLGTKNWEPKSGSRDTGNRELGSENWKQKLGDQKLGTESWQPKTASPGMHKDRCVHTKNSTSKEMNSHEEKNDEPVPAMARKNDWMPDWMAMSTLKMQPPTLKETRQAIAGTLGTWLPTSWGP